MQHLTTLATQAAHLSVTRLDPRDARDEMFHTVMTAYHEALRTASPADRATARRTFKAAEKTARTGTR